MALATLAVRSRTVVDNVYQIERWYERLERELGRLGAYIKRGMPDADE
jgi:UDP-N-acetylglucosamine enolpyruvyl transferase